MYRIIKDERHDNDFKIRNPYLRSAKCRSTFVTPGADASDSDSYPSYLEAKVIAHLPLSGGTRRMFSQQEGSRQFLYVQQSSQQGVTVIDITKPELPRWSTECPWRT